MSDRPTRVSLFVTCLVDLLYPEVGESSVALLEREGVTVGFPASQTCCGQPPFNSGFHEDARRLARTMLDAFEDSEAVVSPSGSCTAMIRSYYPHLFHGRPEEGRAEALAAKTFELSEFLVDVLGVERVDGAAWRGSVTYHDSCHGLRELGLKGQGRKLVQSVEGVELVEMARPDMCCGFGGTFSVRLPDVAAAMADDKIAQTEATGAAIVLTGDAGCLMHVAGRMGRRGSGVRPMHLATFLAAAAGLVPSAAGRPAG
jgi:L-lactate dehydrogenase complex protein LldE